MYSRDLVSRGDVHAWLQGISAGYLQLAISIGAACVFSACSEESPAYAEVEATSARQALAQAGGAAVSAVVCGDGVVDSGEACDDGNLLDADGCSASCQLDNDAQTPGDDRNAYVSCTNTSNGASLTCGPGLGCCPNPTNSAGPVCGKTRADCGFVMAFIVFCDGPEDCTSGNSCVLTRSGRVCASSGYSNVCHTDSDCPTDQPHCDPEGLCRPAQ